MKSKKTQKSSIKSTQIGSQFVTLKNSFIAKLFSFKKTLSQKTAPFQKWVGNHRLVAVGILLLMVVGLSLASIIFKPEVSPAQEAVKQPLKVKVITFGQTPVSEEVVGVVKNQSTITLVAQAPGPVTSIKAVEGQNVRRGSLLVSQETAYGAGNAAVVQKQIAGEQYQLAKTSFESTQEIVDKTRSQADSLRDNTEELRKINEKSINETKDLISLSETQAKALESQITSAPDEASKSLLRGQLIGVQGGINAARAQLRNIEYQVDTDNPPDKLADFQKDLIYKTTDLQLKSSEIQRNIAQLGFRAASIAEAATRVSSPVSGRVERILVKEGQFLNPGTPVAVVSGEADFQIVVSLSGSLAALVDEQKLAVIDFQSLKVNLPITHLSKAPVNGSLYDLVIDLPAEYLSQVHEGHAVEVSLPLYSVSIVEGNYFVPIDSVFISNTETFVFVNQSGKAQKRLVTLGSMNGDHIEIKEGLQLGDEVILDRRVLDGQSIEVEFLEIEPAAIVELG